MDEINNSVSEDLEKRTQLKEQVVDWYEPELEKSGPSGRVMKMKERSHPPVLIKAFKSRAQEGKRLLPNFWPADIYLAAKGHEVPADKLTTYVHNGEHIKGCYLDLNDGPLVAGVIQLSDVEKVGFSKEQVISDSHKTLKGQTGKLWGKCLLNRKVVQRITYTTNMFIL